VRGRIRVDHHPADRILDLAGIRHWIVVMVSDMVAMSMGSVVMPTVGVAVDGTFVGHGSPRLIRWD
jgi:hypothetical protein